MLNVQCHGCLSSRILGTCSSCSDITQTHRGQQNCNTSGKHKTNEKSFSVQVSSTAICGVFPCIKGLDPGHTHCVRRSNAQRKQSTDSKTTRHAKIKRKIMKARRVSDTRRWRRCNGGSTGSSVVALPRHTHTHTHTHWEPRNKNRARNAVGETPQELQGSPKHLLVCQRVHSACVVCRSTPQWTSIVPRRSSRVLLP